MKSTLLLVHPGSLCGSANMNLGHVAAGRTRAAICADIDGWHGNFAVLHGMLSDEIERFHTLHRSIQDAAGMARKGGFKTVERFGCDCEEPGIEDGLEDILKELAADPDTDRFVLTGAWFDPARKTGCVTAVEKLLLEKSFQCLVLDSAAILEDEDTNEE